MKPSDVVLPDDAELERRVQASLEAVANEELRVALLTFRTEYSTFAHRNARRLELINETFRRLLRGVLILGVLFALVQLALGILALSLESRTRTALEQNQAAVVQIQTGRRIALGVSCATQGAIAQAGRLVIAGPPTPPPLAQELALEHLGFPPFKIRHAAQQRQADAYVTGISVAIDRRIGHKGDHLVRADGTIDCTRYAALARLR